MNSLLASLKSASLSSPLHRQINCTVKVLDDAKGIVRYVASDETLDCYNEIIRAAGWKFTNFAKNAPFVDSHDYSTIKNLLGQVVEFGVQGKELIEDVQYSREPNTLAEWAYKMVRDGFLKAVSVGFYPLSYASRWDSDKTLFLEQVGLLGLDAPTAAKLNVVYVSQEQIELSQCVIGANPNALAKAYKAGCLTDEDIDKFSAMKALLVTAAPAADRADADAASRRAKLAILANIQSHL